MHACKAVYIVELVREKGSLTAQLTLAVHLPHQKACSRTTRTPSLCPISSVKPRRAVLGLHALRRHANAHHTSPTHLKLETSPCSRNPRSTDTLDRISPRCSRSKQDSSSIVLCITALLFIVMSSLSDSSGSTRPMPSCRSFPSRRLLPHYYSAESELASS